MVNMCLISLYSVFLCMALTSMEEKIRAVGHGVLAQSVCALGNFAKSGQICDQQR